jgi:beta-galactosidase
MAEMGLKVVRLAEFAWQKMEPSEGRYDFGWLDRILNILDRYGVKVVLGTPSACPPAWLVEAHPDILPVDSRGRRMSFGGRHHDCQSNPDYRNHVERIVSAMARMFGRDSRVAGWQIDNELGNSHHELCHCAHCRRAFQAWLEKRYGSIDHLNKCWGTVFWSQTYDRFEQIPSPALTATEHSPSLLLDWKRFHSDLIVDFQESQVRVIRSATKDQFITHNFMGLFDLIDYFKLAQSLDFVSHDQYPLGFWGALSSPPVLAEALDLMAGLKRRAFWVMEQQAGITGWQTMSPAPRAGQLALWAAQSVAHGADTVVFFRWRTCTVGTEQYWHGILPHNGVPGRRYDELKGLIQGLGPLMPRFEGALSEAEVGILYSYEQNWAFEIQPHHPDLDYISYVEGIYASFYECNVPVDFLSQEADFGRYKIVVAPLLLIDLPGVAERLNAFVRTGGTLVLTMRTGVKDSSNVCQTAQPLPGVFGELAGIEILDYDCLRLHDVPVERNGQAYVAKLWWDVVSLKGAEAWASGRGAGHVGEPAVTRHSFGAGKVWYVGTCPDEELMRTLCAAITAEAGVDPLGPKVPGIELSRRRAKDHDYLFVLNHFEETNTISVDPSWTKLIGSDPLEPFGFQIYERPKGP